MLSIRSETLALIEATRFYLEELPQPAIFLASGEDCDYFRKHYLSAAANKQVPSQPPLQKFHKKSSLSEFPSQTSSKQTVPEEPVAPSKTNTQPLDEKHSPQIVKTPSAKSDSTPKDCVTLQTPVAASRFKPTQAEATENTTAINLGEPPSPSHQENFDDLRKIWNKITAGAPVFDEIPNDEIAKKIANRWKTKNAAAEISILAYQEPPSQRILLEQIAKAIHTVLGPARIVQAEPIEKEKQWEAFLSVPHLKLTIACDYTLWQLRGLMHHYREAPSQGTRHLGPVPVFLLPDLSLYLKDPLLKRSLWKALCQTLSS